MISTGNEATRGSFGLQILFSLRAEIVFLRNDLAVTLDKIGGPLPSHGAEPLPHTEE